jgi:ribosome-associated heat shock protein Hsp15
MRIDRWLWFARFFKTRSLATNAVRSGRVRVDGERAKAAREVYIGNALSIRRGDSITDVCVLKIPFRRGPAAEVAGLYEETSRSIARREDASGRKRSVSRFGSPTQGRPDKKTRRLLRKQQRR